MKLLSQKWMSRNQSYSVWYLVGTALMFLLVFGCVCLAEKKEQQADPDPLRFKQEIDEFSKWDRKNSVPDDATLFVGSSSIRMWATNKSFGDMKVINRGFGGAHIYDVIYYAERIVLPYKPKVIVFYAGDNDIAGGKSPQRVFDDYQKFVKIVHKKLPKTRIIFITIKPSRSRWSLWPRMKEANTMIGNLCKTDRRLFFADAATGLLGEDGKPKEELFLKDQLHLSEQGYKLWTSILKPIIIKAQLQKK